MSKTIKTVTLSNGKPIRILTVNHSKIRMLIHAYNREDLFAALGLVDGSLSVYSMWPSEHDYDPKQGDPMTHITDTALLLLTEKSPASFEQRKLIIELLRMNFKDRGI